MIQQGQVFKLKARCADGEPLWAYRYRVAGRGSARLQVGGFSTRAEAQRALQNKLARLLPGGRSTTLTLGEWVEEYLDTHQGERVTVAKLRWLLGKATAELGEVRLTVLSPEQVCAWRLTVPEGHRFEATQALRPVHRNGGGPVAVGCHPLPIGVFEPFRGSAICHRLPPVAPARLHKRSMRRRWPRWVCAFRGPKRVGVS